MHDGGWPDVFIRTGTYPWQHLFPMPATPGIGMPGTRSSAATKCISEVPGLANGLTVAVAAAMSLTLFLLLVSYSQGGLLREPTPASFYAVFPHNTLVAMFGTVFGFAILALAIGVTRFWRNVSPGALQPGAGSEAARNALTLKYLDGCHGEGCNEADDRFTPLRPRFHHLTFYCFML